MNDDRVHDGRSRLLDQETEARVSEAIGQIGDRTSSGPAWQHLMQRHREQQRGLAAPPLQRGILVIAMLLVLVGASLVWVSIGRQEDKVDSSTGNPDPDSDSVLVSWNHPRFGAPPTTQPEGRLTIEGCSWEGPGRWTADLRWESDPAPTPAEPLELAINIAYGIDDSDPDPPRRTAGTAVVAGNGPFTASFTSSTRILMTGLDGLWTFQSFVPPSLDGRCDAQLLGVGPDSWDDGVPLTLRPEPIAVPDDPGSAEALAAQVPLDDSWSTDPMAPLALLVASNDLPVDRLFVNPNDVVSMITVRHFGPCTVAIVVQFEGTTLQTRDCEPDLIPDIADFAFADSPGQSLTDDDWDVTVVAFEESYIDSVQAFAFAGAVEPSAAPQIDREAIDQLPSVDFRPNDEPEENDGPPGGNP